MALEFPSERHRNEERSQSWREPLTHHKKDPEEPAKDLNKQKDGQSHLYFCDCHGWRECQVCQDPLPKASEVVDTEQVIQGPPRKLTRMDPTPTATPQETTMGAMTEFFGRLNARQIRAAALILRCAFLERMDHSHILVEKPGEIWNPYSGRCPRR